MDFGRVPFEQIDTIDYSLPKEPQFNKNILRGAKAPVVKFYVGFEKWGRKEWIGKLYPKGTKDAQFLNEYQEHFNSIELNATHYKLYPPSEINKWVGKVNEEFKFFPKVYQGISHFGSFTEKDFLSNTFFNSLNEFGQHLGSVFLQVSDKFAPKRKEELFHYLASLPKDKEFFLEVRHREWYTQPHFNELLYTLQSKRVGFLITDTLGRRDVAHMHLTIPKTFVRFVGAGGHQSDIKRLDQWVERINYWAENGISEVAFFLHMLDASYAPEAIQFFIHQLNLKCNAGLKEIEFIS